jgi:hypothetical protein
VPSLILILRAALASFSLLALAAAWAEVTARQDGPGALAQAAAIEQIIPGAGANARRYERLADLSPGTAHNLERALQIQPRLTYARISLGLVQESAGDLAASESTLLEAALFDHRYLPAWTLANFYFRHERPDKFWTWAAHAARLTYDDFRPLLRLCDAFEANPPAVLDRLNATPALERAYLDFLIGAQGFDKVESVAQRLIARGGLEDKPRLAELVTREIRANRVQPAMTIWNALFSPLDAVRGPVLTNGDLRTRPSGTGFDWRLHSGGGIDATWSEGSIRFEFSGAQPDFLALLEQPIPVQAAKRYRLTFEYLIGDVSRGAAIPRWEVDARPLTQLRSSDSWQTGSGIFSANTGLARLRLVYRRVPGMVPFQGRTVIRNIRLDIL